MKHVLWATRAGIDSLAALVPFAGTDQDRPVLTAVCFMPDKAAATDSYALGLAPIGTYDQGEDVGTHALGWVTEEAQLGDRTVMVEAKPLKKALASAKPRDVRGAFTSLTFDTEERTITVEGQDGTATTLPLLEGTFLNVDALLPSYGLEDAGYLPAMSADLLAKFGPLAFAVGQQGAKRNQGPFTTGVVLVPAPDGATQTVKVQTLNGTLIGLQMAIRGYEDVRSAKAVEAEG